MLALRWLLFASGSAFASTRGYCGHYFSDCSRRCLVVILVEVDSVVLFLNLENTGTSPSLFMVMSIKTRRTFDGVILRI